MNSIIFKDIVCTDRLINGPSSTLEVCATLSINIQTHTTNTHTHTMPHICTTCIRTQLCAHADTHTNIHACSCVCIPHTHKVAQEHTKNCWKAKTVRRQTESGEKVMWSHCQKNTHNLLTWHGILSGAGVSVSSPLHLTNSSSHPNLKMKYTHTHAHTHTTHTPQTHITHTHTHTHKSLHC